MVFFGYISSLIVAIMLAMFYIGNVAQHVIVATYHKYELLKEVRAAEASNKTVSYFAFETKKETITKSIKSVAAIATQTSVVNRFNTRVVNTYYTKSSKPPLSVYQSTLFTRPPPVLS